MAGSLAQGRLQWWFKRGAVVADQQTTFLRRVALAKRRPAARLRAVTLVCILAELPLNSRPAGEL